MPPRSQGSPTLKNTAVLFAQQIGDDLNPTIQELIDGANELLEGFLAMDEAQRQQIVRMAAYAAAAGPVLLVLGKATKGIGTLSTGIGKFATAVGKAGGGMSGFLSVLSKSPAVWLAIAAATVTATVAFADYISGAKQAREALAAMNETAQQWKDTAAETFYGTSEGVSFFGMSEGDFSRQTQSAQDWLDGLLKVWTDGEKETDEIVSSWTDSFKALTASTREELSNLKATADESGYTGVSEQLARDIETLDSLDAEIEALLKKRQNGYFSEDDQIRLQELIDTREAIEIKYNLTPADTDGFEGIAQKVEAEVARAQARGQSGADVSVYENAVKAAAEGMAAVNAELDAQYDKEYAVVQLIEDSTERQNALDALNARYNENRLAAAREYAQTLAGVVMPVWEQDDIQQANQQVDTLLTKLREYSMAGEGEKPAILEDLADLSSEMDEGALTEYLGLLTQIQSLMDSGMSEEEVQSMFPEIDVSGLMDQFAGVADYIDLIKTDLPGLYSMFNESLPEEVLKIATDLDMTGAQARWNAFAANPGADHHRGHHFRIYGGRGGGSTATQNRSLHHKVHGHGLKRTPRRSPRRASSPMCLLMRRSPTVRTCRALPRRTSPRWSRPMRNSPPARMSPRSSLMKSPPTFPAIWKQTVVDTSGLTPDGPDRLCTGLSGSHRRRADHGAHAGRHHGDSRPLHGGRGCRPVRALAGSGGSCRHRLRRGCGL